MTTTVSNTHTTITIDQALQQAVTLHREGKLRDAERLYLAILKTRPDHPAANHNLGVLAVQSQQPLLALPHFKRALESGLDQQQYWVSLLDALIQTGQYQEARQLLLQGRQRGLKGDTVDAIAVRLDEKIIPHQESLESGPDMEPSSYEIDNLEKLFGRARYSEAEACARKLIDRFPRHGFVCKTLGAILHRQGRIQESLEYMQQATSLLPDDVEAFSNLGATLNALGRLKDAEACHRKALKLKPEYAEAHNNLGITLKAQGRLEEAKESYRNALKFKPEFAEVLTNLGVTLKELGQLEEAADSYLHALDIRPDLPEAQNNLGVILRDLGKPDEAEARYRTALALNPGYTDAFSNLIFTMNSDNRHTHSDCIQEARRYGQTVAAMATTQRYSDWCCAPCPDRLRVGLVSGDLHNHPVGYFLEHIVARIDSSRIELIAYQTRNYSDALSARIRPFFSSWKSLCGLNNEDAARLIHDDGVHLLLDLSGHTSNNRLPLFAWKPAPVQVSWLGYFATTGVSAMDYVLADETGVPDVIHDQFTEKIWYLPDTRLCFTAPGEEVPVSQLPALNNGFITFGCFQNLAKLGDQTIELWRDIFSAIPDARLRVQCKQLGSPAMRKEVLQKLSRYGIAPERVSLHGAVSRADYLAAHADIDLILDTFPYPGGTTTCEGLWMGVPTLTRAGSSMLSRQGASILTAAGLAEFVAVSNDDFVARGVAFTGDLQKLNTLRTNLRKQVLASPLFDAPRFAGNLERALWGMWSELRPDVLLNVDSIAQTDDRTSASTTTAASGHNSLVATASNRKLRRAVRIKAGSDQAGIQSTIGTDADLASRFEMLRVAGNYKDAEILAREITVRFPNSGFGWKALGAALKAQGRTRESLIPMQMAAKLASFDAGTHSNLGVTLKDLGRLEEAAASFRSALKIRPDFAEGHNNLGNTLRQLGRMLEARACFERALELKPDYTDALNNYGNVLYDSGLLESAENCYRQALQVRPDFCEAHNNLGNTLAHLGCIEEAMACFRRALALNPDYLGAQSNLLFNLNYSAGYDQSYYLAEARKYGHMASVSSQHRFSAWRCTPRPDRLRIGLVSGDLRSHPVGYFLESILARIDPGRIELLAYTTDPRVDSMTTRIRPFFSAWNSLVGLDDAAAANLIHADGIHVLLDLSGHTDKNRLPVFARKPAPLQISWLGYFATTGVAEIDYFLADATGVPDHLRWQFTETVWHLPETRLCFTAPPENVPVASLPARDNGFVTFGCFQNLAKVGDNVVRLWGIILAALPDARLRLQTRELGDPATCERFRLRLQKNNIAIERVILQGAVSRTEYLAAHADVDLILDTFPYPGGTTTCEALWMGVPTVTLAGDSLLARQGASILTSAGLADFVALSEADYIANAVTLAADVTRLARLRSGLRQQILTSPLFDAPRFARNFEDAVWSIWNQRQQML